MAGRRKERFPVKRLLGRRRMATRPDVVEYLIVWDEQDKGKSWEPASEMRDCDELIEDYEKRVEKEKRRRASNGESSTGDSTVEAPSRREPAVTAEAGQIGVKKGDEPARPDSSMGESSGEASSDEEPAAATEAGQMGVKKSYETAEAGPSDESKKLQIRQCLLKQGFTPETIDEFMKKGIDRPNFPTIALKLLAQKQFGMVSALANGERKAQARKGRQHQQAQLPKNESLREESEEAKSSKAQLPKDESPREESKEAGSSKRKRNHKKKSTKNK